MTAPLRLDSPLQALRGVGPQRAAELAEAGLTTVRDLLFHLPFRYEDRRRVASTVEVNGPGPWTLTGRLLDVRQIRTRRRGFTIVRAVVDDGRGALPIVWFNRPYLAQQVTTDQPYLLHGPARPTEGGLWELVNPTCERTEGASQAGTIVPIYPAVRQVGSAAMRRLVLQALPLLDATEAPNALSALMGELPPELARRYTLPPLDAALRALHAPGAASDVEALNRRRSPAHLRLIYGELLELQLELALVRARQVRQAKAHSYRVDERLRRVARDILPFPLTGAQKRALREIVDDLRRPEPMLRLLQGDVGSGKTLVAALALVVALESGLQGAFMAPTELLAEQHFGNLQRLLGSRYRLGLLTASSAEAGAVRRALASGEVQLAVGTHALIQEGVAFRCLGLAVIDEQHRFGVHQRQILQRKGARPDVLVMTATPIPRSLALVAYGDLESSVLDEMPPGRTPIATEVLPTSARREVYRRLREELAGGGQAYVVLPLIEESDQVTAASLAALGEKLRAYLADFPTAMLHGRMPAAEREATMQAFAAGRLRVLLATTVIEVGVDVPSATTMIVESAERFGLAQLHQLRGRVGRGERPSRCVALHGKLSQEGERRLRVFAETSDGFRIAEADLEIRGPGDLLGTRQAGLPAFRVANLVLDREWLERARGDARELVARLAEPALAPLARRLEPRVRERYERFAGG